MRRLLFLLFLSGFSLGCLGQNLNEVKLRKMLVGRWLNLDDSALTVKITRDSIVQSTNGTYPEADLYTYRITRHNCDNKDSIKSPIGYYLKEKDTDDGECLCGAIQSISKDSVRITFTDDLLVLKRIAK
jgi:hypothetical protein